MRKIIIYVSIVLFWIVGVVLFCNLGKTETEQNEH